MGLAKIYRGDCLPFLRGMEDGSVDLIVTDPPFGTNFRTDIFSDGKESVEAMIPQWYAEWHRLLKLGSFCFVFCGILNLNVWIDEALKAGFSYRNMLATRTFTRGPAAKGNFAFEFQPILVFSKGKGKAFNRIDFFPQSEAWRRDRRNKSPSEYTYTYSNWIPSDIAYATETFGFAAKGGYHPNAKNVKLVRFLVEIATSPGGVVLDPFLGSGTTGVAALQAGRDFVGAELNGHWFGKSRTRLIDCDPLANEVVEVGP